MKPRIFLDIDQTLISAEAVDEFDYEKYKSKTKKFVYHDMDQIYLVFERPGLQKFLDWLFDNYIVSIWTAASKDYAVFIIDKIILQNNKKRKIDYVLFYYHCDISNKHKNGSKDLTMIPEIFKLPDYNMKNTVILDDYDEVYNTQPDNCIIAPPFEFYKSGSERDSFLKKLQPKLNQLAKLIRKDKPISDKVKQINAELGKNISTNGKCSSGRCKIK